MVQWDMRVANIMAMSICVAIKLEQKLLQAADPLARTAYLPEAHSWVLQPQFLKSIMKKLIIQGNHHHIQALPCKLLCERKPNTCTMRHHPDAISGLRITR